VGVLLFAGAVFVLWSELRGHSLHEIIAELRAFPRLRLLLALAATVLGYLALAGYDVISLAALGYRLPFRSVAYAAFLAFAFANSLPLSVVAGATVRYRLYSHWGIAQSEAARVVALNTVTYAIGLLATAGLAFAAQPVLVPGFLRLPLRSARPLGFVCLAVVAAYLLWSSRPGGDLRTWRWELPRPTLRLALAQIAISAADWVFSGAALYVLLPNRVPFHVFFAVFLLGQIAALVAQVPAGLGVFEAVVLWSLGPAIPVPALLIALVGYRLVYFLLPLLLATGIWALHEAHLWYRRSHAARRRRAAAR
jgi:phosphatidylglycerol lysyltransferase